MKDKSKRLTVIKTDGVSSSASSTRKSGSVGGGVSGVAGSSSSIDKNVILDILQNFGKSLFLSKQKDDRSKGKVASDVGFEVGKYVSGASGAIIYKDATTGQTVGELDKLRVRMKAYFETLEIINVNSVGGKMILSPAGSVKCIGVDEVDADEDGTADAYRCYFLGEQDGEKIENRFVAGDQAFSQMFNAKTGVSNKVSNHYYWRLVTAVSEDAVEYDGKQCHYIDLSIADCDADSDVPKAGDVINQRGSREDADRMNFIEFSSVDAFSPNITLFHGVNSYSLDGKAYVDYGVDKSTNKAYMNVYGDMYVGDRNGTAYLRYTQDEGLELKGKLAVGSTYNGSEIGSLFDKQKEDLESFASSVAKEFDNIRNEMDGAIDTWFGEETPTLDNYPASEWATDTDKDSHLGDLYYTNDGKAYRFQYTETDGYYWSVIEDSEVVKALELAQKAQDTADGKRRVFIDTPYPPYDLGDLWAGGKDSPLKRCINARESGSYYESDWALADDTHAYADAVKAELEKTVSTTKTDLENAITDAEAAANTYTDEAKAAINKTIDELEAAKANIDDVYTKAVADEEISKAEQAAIDAAKKASDAAIALSEVTVKAYADGVVDAEEEARIKQAEENLEAAKAYAEEKAAEALEEANKNIATFDYLKAALGETTEIDGGLILTSLVKLQHTDNIGSYVMSGINGIYNEESTGGGIATWWGGDLHEWTDYYEWNGAWKVKDDVEVPTNMPSGAIRFDGTGYFANGNFWWDADGQIHADPTALLLSFDVGTGDETLAATIINIRKEIALFNSMWTLKTDASGNSYLLSSYHLATNGGITMYSTDDIDIPSILDSLPIASTSAVGVASFDPASFKVDTKGMVSFIGSVDGGTASSVEWDNISGVPSWIGDTKPSYTYSEISGTPTLLSSFTDDVGYLTAHQTIYGLTINNSGGTSVLSYTPNSATASLTLTKEMVGLGSVENTALSTWKGTTNITTLGTITSGTWNGSKIANGYLANSAVTISGTSVSLGGSITQAALRTALGLGSNAYTSTAYLPLSGGTMTGSISLPSNAYIRLSVDGYSLLGLDADKILIGTPNYPSYIRGTETYITQKTFIEGNNANILTLKRNNTTGGAFVYCKAMNQNNIGWLAGSDSNHDFIFNYTTDDLATNTNMLRLTNEGHLINRGNIVIGSVNVSDNVVALNVYGKGWFSNGVKLYSDSSSYNTNGITFSSAVGGSILGRIGGDTNGNIGIFPTVEFVVRPGYTGSGTAYGLKVASDGSCAITYNTINSGLSLYSASGKNAWVTYYPNAQIASRWYVGAETDSAFRAKYSSDHGTTITTKMALSTTGLLSTVMGLQVNGGTVISSSVPSIAMPYSSYISFGGYHVLRAETNATVLASPTASSAGNIILRPNGNTSTTHQWSIDSEGKIVSSCSNYACLTLNRTTSTGGSFIVFNPYAQTALSWIIGAGNTTQCQFIYGNSGTNIVKAYLDNSGNLLVTGGITMYSDIRKKTKLQDVELTLKQVADAPLIEHYYNGDEKKTTHVGSIAQYWAGMNDWFCKEDGEGFLTMEIQNAALASAISVARELVRYESKTDRKIRMLKKRIGELEDKIEQLEKK